MPSFLLLIHLVAVGVWLGCVLTEALFERALLGQGRAYERLLADLHLKVDQWVEVPVLLAVLLTGGLMVRSAAWDALLVLKVGLGLLAVVANAVCVGLVWRRAQAARAGQWVLFEAIDRWQHRLGAVVLLSMLGALGVGLSRI